MPPNANTLNRASGDSELPFTVRPISAYLGAVISGVDLSKPLDETTKQALRDTLLKHTVIFFEGQTITPDQQREFALTFGDEFLIHYGANRNVDPDQTEQPDELTAFDSKLTRAPGAFQGESVWHTDITYEKRPAGVSVLTARVRPSVGGDTEWGSLIRAYETLSPPLQRLLEGLEAEHYIGKNYHRIVTSGPRNPQYEKLWDKFRTTYPPVVHPLIRTHPTTGKKILFVNRGFTLRILGLSWEESEALLDFLFNHAEKPENTVRWVWKEGDVAVWENRQSIHRAVPNYDINERRVVERFTVLGEVPFFKTDSGEVIAPSAKLLSNVTENTPTTSIEQATSA